MKNIEIFIKKIRNIKSFKDLIIKIGNKINYIRRNGSFAINNWIVSIIYGKVVPYDVFQINPEDVEEIRKILNSSKEVILSNNPSKGKLGNQLEQELYDFMNAEQTWFEIKKNSFFDNFFKKIKPFLKSYLKSPFVIIHLKAWKTRPNIKPYFDSHGNQRGPNRMHADGYPPGHYKCMIYLQPLNSSFGKFQFEQKIFESEKAGCSVLFNNNLKHQSITGSSHYRYCLELTLMRTVIEVDMLKCYEGAPDDKWLLQAYQAYI